MITIYAIDDSNEFLDSINGYFNSYSRDFKLIGTYSNLAELEEEAYKNDNEEDLLDNFRFSNFQPDIVLMDMSFTLVGRSNDYGIHLTKEIKRIRPKQKIIILAEDVDENEVQYNLIRSAFEAGATSYLSKEDAEFWPQCIKEAYNSDRGAVTPNIIQSIIDQWSKQKAYGLSEREVEAIYCLSGDMRIKKVGETMKIGFDGANFHIKNARIKLGVKTNQGLVAAAFREGIIQ